MPNIDIAKIQLVVDAIAEHNGNKAEAARKLGMPRTTVRDYASLADTLGIVPAGTGAPGLTSLKKEVLDLKKELTSTKAESLTQAAIRRNIFGLATHEAAPPSWTRPSAQSPHNERPGVPTLFLSDFHWGESVLTAQTDGVNSYNLEIASDRLKRTIDRTIDLCFNHMTNAQYPGIVVLLGGDMISGDIHEELRETNEAASIPLVFDLFDHLVAAIDRLQAKFNNTFVVCEYGNHGRLTHKPRNKESAATNYDWLLYNMLERHYKSANAKVQFLIPDGPDAFFSIYGTNYVLTHGDRIGVKGGDGVIGMLSPIARGVKKVKAAHAARGRRVDYVLMGHFHQRLRLEDAMVNGTLKGPDEYSLNMRFTPQPPTQHLWFTHPEHGITFEVPILIEDPYNLEPSSDWVRWVDTI